MVLRFLHWLTDRLPARFIDGENNEPYLERYHLFGIKCLGDDEVAFSGLLAKWCGLFISRCL